MTAKKKQKYVELLEKAKAKTAEDYKHTAAVAEKELELLITKKKVELAKAEEAIHHAKSSVPFNPDTIIEAFDDKTLLEIQIGQMEELKDELFG